MAHPTTTIKTLAQGFAKHIHELKAPEYKESQVRRHYIDPFWELLGWDTNNAEQRAPQDVEVVVEPSMDSVEDTGMRSREPDYLFRLNGFSRFIVEAKKPSVDLDTNRNAIYQAKRYAWNASIPFAILTDFEQFRLYDTTLKPIIGEPTRGLIREFSFDFPDYPDKWDILKDTFGRDAVASGSLEKLLAKVKKLRAGKRIRAVDRMLIDLKGAEPVDRVFLDHLEVFRQHFARAIYHDNKKDFPEADTLHGAAKLTEVVQRLMDRLVFMRVCEDRGISKWGDLRELLDRVSNERSNLTEALRAQFRELDREYNGYLFKFNTALDEISLPDEVISDFVRTLYPPDGPWDFAKIGDDILGIVYERFLGHTVTVKRGQASVEEKPEVRHAGGVYYTPRFVVDTIIRRVIKPKIDGKSPAEILDIKILDPACGSGSFLVTAFQYLIDHCVDAIRKNPSLASMPATPRARTKRKDIAFKDKKGNWLLAPDFKAALLTSCIHGVDIDQQAVEVTIMSLYLKMLEGELPPNWQKEWLENELLPSLDSNILCGNSLIDEASYDAYLLTKRGSLFSEDADTRFRINRFDWKSRTRGFGRILDVQGIVDRRRNGFDCIIGNPPYIRVQELNKWASEECEFYKWKYKSAAKGNYDIYVVFTERALQLLAPDGLLGFIMPHKFWQAQYGAGLRKLIADGKHLRAVIDFREEQVFSGATTYTAIHTLSRAANSGLVAYSATTKLYDGIAQMIELCEGVPIAHHAAHYAGIVHECAMRRYVMEQSHKLQQAAGGAKSGEELCGMVDAMQAETARRYAGRMGDVQLICLSDVQPERVAWLWPGRIALGKLTLIAGDPGLGKSFVTIDIAARVSTGTAWPDAPGSENIRYEPSGVLLIADEDGLADTIRPRLDAARADPRNVMAMKLPGLDLSRDRITLERAIGKVPGCKLVVIDPITAYLGKTDSHNNAEVRGVLTPLADMADRLNVAVLLVTHLNKSATGNAQYRVSGSVGFMATVRTAWHVVKDKTDPKRRLVLPSKNNIAPDLTGLGYQLVPPEADGDSLPGAGVAAVKWEALPVDMTADDAMASEGADDERTEREQAAEWLRETLAGGSMSSEDVFKRAESEGFSRKTLRRAAKRIGVRMKPSQFQGGWRWSMPDAQDAPNAQTCPELASVAHRADGGNTGGSGQL
ncbi:MAG: Eco57I restriction-modification methylase domain-containing protein [Phycisphaerales bacterium]